MTKREIIARNIIEARKKFVAVEANKNLLLAKSNELTPLNNADTYLASANYDLYVATEFIPAERKLAYLQAEYLRILATIKCSVNPTEENLLELKDRTLDAYNAEELYLNYEPTVPSEYTVEKLHDHLLTLKQQKEQAVQDPIAILNDKIEKTILLLDNHYVEFNNATDDEAKGIIYRKSISPLERDLDIMKRELIDLKHKEAVNEALTKAQARLEAFKARTDNRPVIEFLSHVLDKDIEWFKAQAGLRRQCASSSEYYSQSDAPKSVKDFICSYCNSSYFTSEIINLAVQDAEIRVGKLNQAIEKKVGKVSECHLKYNPNSGLDGRVIGENGEARLTTILAGGYNVQRLHYRTLVKVIK